MENTIDIEKIIREYIDKTIHMSLATASNNTPWVCEVQFAYDDELNIYFRSPLARRHSQEIASNSSVAGNIVDKYEVGGDFVGVYFEGNAKMLEAGDEQNIAFECIKARLNTSDDILEEATIDKGFRFYKISVDNWYVYGAFEGNSARKYKLS